MPNSAPKSPGKSHPPETSAKPSAREARLAQALRANLKRRKAQSRQKAAAAPQGAPEEPDAGEAGGGEA